MSAQQGYERYMPGDVVRMQIHIRHRPMHLWAMEAVFLHSGGEEELQAEVDDLRTNSKRAALPGGGIGHESVADLSVPIRRGTPLGVYRLVEVAVQTYGGRTFGYTAQEEEGLGDLGFELGAEPEERPALAMRVFPRSEEP
jgi:hypothetical protein